MSFRLSFLQGCRMPYLNDIYPLNDGLMRFYGGLMGQYIYIYKHIILYYIFMCVPIYIYIYTAYIDIVILGDLQRPHCPPEPGKHGLFQGNHPL